MKDTEQTRLQAVALKYDPSQSDAPVLTAVGQGAVAESIIKTAHEHSVPVVEDSSTAEVLSRFSVGDTIPPVLYEAVAQVLLFVASMDAQAGERFKRYSR